MRWLLWLAMGGSLATVAGQAAKSNTASCLSPSWESASWWKKRLSNQGQSDWFSQTNKMVQAKIDQLVQMAEDQLEFDPTLLPYNVWMVGDSTMRHQYTTLCSFLAEREGRRFNPCTHPRFSNRDVPKGDEGCCIDTGEGGGRGLCFQYRMMYMLDPVHARDFKGDAYYFGAALHLLHLIPARHSQPLAVTQWCHYEQLLEEQVHAVFDAGGPDMRVVFMMNHAVMDQKFVKKFAAVRDAYSLPPDENEYLPACLEKVSKALDAVQLGEVGSSTPLDALVMGEGNFTSDHYCTEGMMTHHGSYQLVRRARHTMAKLGIPVVDTWSIVEGQLWATKDTDGRHYVPLVPLEVFSFLGALLSPPPPPFIAEAVVDVRGYHRDP